MARPLSFRRLSVLLFVALTLTAAGCGGGKREVAKVSGKVTVAGKNPLPGGNITFYLISDPTQVGGSVINSDGTFEVVNAPVGECKVVVDNSNLETFKDPMMMGAGKANAKMGGPGMASKAAPPGPSASSKEKMNASAKAAELAPEMNAGKDTGTMKYVKIDPAFTKVETTTLRHTVNQSGDSNVTIDVK